MDIIDFRYRPPYGSYRETIMYRDLERAKRCSEAFGMNQSPAVAARDMEASLAEMDRAGIGMAQVVPLGGLAAGQDAGSGDLPGQGLETLCGVRRCVRPEVQPGQILPGLRRQSSQAAENRK